MNPLTGQFDLVLQIREEVIERILAASHEAGVLQHHFVHAQDGRRVELQIGRPALSLVSAPSADRWSRALVTSRVAFQARELDQSGQLGVVGVAEVTVRATTGLSTGDPGPLSGADLVVGWQETTAGDITVHGVQGQEAAWIVEALLGFVRSFGGGRFPLPSLTGLRAGSLAFRFLPCPPNRRPVAAIGLNTGTTIKGAKNDLQAAFIRGDWALAISSAAIIDQIAGELEGRLGSLPPPLGSAPVVISEHEACALPTPIGCVDHATQRVILETLNVGLVDGGVPWLIEGGIVIGGTLRVETDAFYVPDVTATFASIATLSLGPNQQIAVSVSRPWVGLGEWYADLADFLSQGALEGAVRDGVQQALQSGVAQGGISQLFSSQLLSSLASLGKVVNLTITPAATSIEVTPHAVIVHGTIAVPGPTRPPMADGLSFTADREAPGLQVLSAGQSWSPGGTVVQYRWDFGDGASETWTGNDLRFATQHDYAPGEYTARITLTDELGRTAMDDVPLRVGLLALTADNWTLPVQAGPVVLGFRVHHDGQPVRRASVTAAVPGWQEQQTTGLDGSCSLTLPPSQFAPLPNGVAMGDVWATSWMDIQAAKPGFRPVTHRLYVGDPLLRFVGGTWIVPVAPAPFGQDFRVATAQGPAVGAMVTLSSPGWQTQGATGAGGICHFTIDPVRFEPTSVRIGDWICTGRLKVEASKPGCHPVSQWFYTGYEVPDWTDLPGLRERLDKWWEWVTEVVREVGDIRVLPVSVQDLLVDAALTFDLLGDVLDVGEQGSRALPLTDLVGIDLTTGGQERARQRVAQVFATVGERVTEAQRVVEQARHGSVEREHTGQASPGPAILDRLRWPSWAGSVKVELPAGLELNPRQRELTDGVRRATQTLGHLLILQQRETRFPPLATLLGLESVEPEAVARRVRDLFALVSVNLVTVRQELELARLDGRPPNGPAEG